MLDYTKLEIPFILPIVFYKIIFFQLNIFLDSDTNIELRN